MGISRFASPKSIEDSALSPDVNISSFQTMHLKTIAITKYLNYMSQCNLIAAIVYAVLQAQQYCICYLLVQLQNYRNMLPQQWLATSP
jgi:hypothetical protein